MEPSASIDFSPTLPELIPSAAAIVPFLDWYLYAGRRYFSSITTFQKELQTRREKMTELRLIAAMISTQTADRDTLRGGEKRPMLDVISPCLACPPPRGQAVCEQQTTGSYLPRCN